MSVDHVIAEKGLEEHAFIDDSVHDAPEHVQSVPKKLRRAVSI